MDKIYKLLRNNQQTGPYTFEELVQLGLKPFDLIWADGRTAGWMYPSEIDVFKPYIAEAKPEPLKAVAPAEAEPVPGPVQAPAETVVPPAATREPATIPATATHIFISLPAGAGAARMTAPAQKGGAEPGSEEESPGQKLERKALELRQKVQALAGQKKEQDAEPTLDTKYTRSLDDIKEEYSLWMHQQKHGRRRVNLPKKQLLVAALVMVAVGLGYTALKWLPGTDAPAAPSAMSQAPAVPLQPTPQAVAEEQETEKQSVVNTEVSDRHTRALAELEQANKRIEEDLKHFEGTARTTSTKPFAEDALLEDTPAANGQDEEAYAAVVYQTGTQEANRSADPVERPAASGPEKKVPLSQQIDLKAKYLKTPRGKGIDGLELVLRNTSSQELRTVAIDVFYYKEGNRPLDKETVYFNNIQPGETRTLTAPGNKKATTATYQLGLISTEGGLYVARQ